MLEQHTKIKAPSHAHRYHPGISSSRTVESSSTTRDSTELAHRAGAALARASTACSRAYLQDQPARRTITPDRATMQVQPRRSCGLGAIKSRMQSPLLSPENSHTITPHTPPMCSRQAALRIQASIRRLRQSACDVLVISRRKPLVHKHDWHCNTCTHAQLQSAHDAMLRTCHTCCQSECCQPSCTNRWQRRQSSMHHGIQTTNTRHTRRVIFPQKDTTVHSNTPRAQDPSK